MMRAKQKNKTMKSEVNNFMNNTLNEKKKQIIDLVNKIKYEVSEQQLAELAGCATPLSEAEFVDWHEKIDELDLTGGPSWLNGEAAAQLRAIILHRVTDLTSEVGGRMVAIGKRVIKMVFEMIQRFPRTAKALMVMAVLLFFVTNVPLIGPLLQPIVTAVCMVVGGMTFLDECIQNMGVNFIN